MDTAALGRERHGVGDQVPHYLLHAVGVAVHLYPAAVEIGRDPDGLAVRGRAHRLHCAFDGRHQAHRAELDVQLARDDTGDVQQVLDDLGLSTRVSLDGFQRAPRGAVVETLLAEELHPPENRLQGRAQLVREHGEELVLRPVRRLHLRTGGALQSQELLALDLRTLALGQVIPHLVLPSPCPQGRVHGGEQGDDTHGPLQERDVAERLHGLQRGQRRLRGVPTAREHEDRQVGPGRLRPEHRAHAPDRRGNERLLGDQGHAGAGLELGREVVDVAANVRAQPGLGEHVGREYGVASRRREHQHPEVTIVIRVGHRRRAGLLRLEPRGQARRSQSGTSTLPSSGARPLLASHLKACPSPS